MADLEYVVDVAQFRLWFAALSHAGVLSVLHLGSGGDDDLIVERGHERAPLTVVGDDAVDQTTRPQLLVDLIGIPLHILVGAQTLRTSENKVVQAVQKLITLLLLWKLVHISQGKNHVLPGLTRLVAVRLCQTVVLPYEHPIGRLLFPSDILQKHAANIQNPWQCRNTNWSTQCRLGEVEGLKCLDY